MNIDSRLTRHSTVNCDLGQQWVQQIFTNPLWCPSDDSTEDVGGPYGLVYTPLLVNDGQKAGKVVSEQNVAIERGEIGVTRHLVLDDSVTTLFQHELGLSDGARVARVCQRGLAGVVTDLEPPAWDEGEA